MKTLIQDVQEILIFIGFGIKVFLMNLLSHFFYIFITIGVTIGLFFLCIQVFHGFTAFWIFLALLAWINYFIRSQLIYKNQLRMNLMFLRYHDKEADFLKTGVEVNYKEIYEDVKKQMQDANILYLPRALAVALVAYRIDTIKRGGTALNDFKPYIRLTQYYLMLQGGLFMVMYIPFGLISFLYTFGLHSGIRLFVFLLGFFFVYFLNAAIVSPVICLLVVRGIKKSVSRD